VRHAQHLYNVQKLIQVPLISVLSKVVGVPDPGSQHPVGRLGPAETVMGSYLLESSVSLVFLAVRCPMLVAKIVGSTFWSCQVQEFGFFSAISMEKFSAYRASTRANPTMNIVSYIS
jgi:hypothetical protein